jgi:hypothetical protein
LHRSDSTYNIFLYHLRSCSQSLVPIISTDQAEDEPWAIRSNATSSPRAENLRGALLPGASATQPARSKLSLLSVKCVRILIGRRYHTLLDLPRTPPFEFYAHPRSFQTSRPIRVLRSLNIGRETTCTGSFYGHSLSSHAKEPFQSRHLGQSRSFSRVLEV